MPEAKMFILEPENFNELSELTGFPVESFQNMLDFDMEAGVVSKVYVIPAKAGVGNLDLLKPDARG